MRQLPKNYCGLTVVMSYPSRMDTKQLLSGYAGTYFDECLYPIKRCDCDVRLASDNSPFFPQTKVVLCLGYEAAKKYIDAAASASLNEIRGSPYIKSDNIIYISTYFPQDCMDMRADYERVHNVHRQTDTEDIDDSESLVEDLKRTGGHTARSNFKFWLRSDVKKAAKLLKQQYRDLLLKQINFDDYRICPSLDEATNALLTAKDSIVTIDIETSPDLALWCVGFSVGLNSPVYVVPVFSYDGSVAYTNIHKFLHALSLALQRNKIVVHNGMFDLLVLSSKYGIGFNKSIFDTMLAAHRLEPEVEKSLGHCLSLYTFVPYHKNEGNFNPQSDSQYQSLLHYNGKDVYTTRLLYEALQNLNIPSVAQVNESVYPYLLMSLAGIRYNKKKLQKIIETNDRYMTQYLRILRIITGTNLLPTSSKSCIEYYHNKLGFRVVKRSEKTKNPSLDEKSLLTLAVQNEHPTIPLVLEYRRLKKQTGSLLFKPWRESESVNVVDAIEGKTSPTYGRNSCQWNLAGTVTFRLSSRKLFGCGTNLQNPDKEILHIYEPDDGKMFVQVDQAGAEALIVAYLCRAGKFRELFTVGIKSHVFVALHLFREVWEAEMGMDLSEYVAANPSQLKELPKFGELDKLIKSSDKWPPEKRYYYMAKQVCHSANYDIQASEFAINVLKNSSGTIRLTLEQASKFLILYHSLFSEIKEWHAVVRSQVKTTKRVKNLFGFHRTFNNFLTEKDLKQAYAWIPQSTVGTITNIAVTNLQNYIEEHKLQWDILNNKHDSYLIQCPVAEVETCKKVAQQFIEADLTAPDGTQFKMRSEAAVGNTWGELK